MSGFAREDVAAKSVNANKQSGQANLAKVMDNLNRTDYIMARNILDMVQAYYTEERMLYITTDKLTNQVEQMTVNQVTPEGVIANDLTLGEYAVIVTNQPEREALEETQFDHAIRLRTDAGIPIPDKYILQSSKLKDKAEIIKDLESESQTPEAQATAQLDQRTREAEVSVLEAEAQSKQSEAQLKAAKTQKELVLTQRELAELQAGGELQAGNEAQIELMKIEQEAAIARQKMVEEFALKREEMEGNLKLKREEMLMTLEIKREEMRQDTLTKRAAAIEQARNAPKPTATTTTT
jgi:hypothetical protein